MRTPMVTRTIKTTKVVVMCVDTESAEVVNSTYVLPRTYKDNKSIMKALENVPHAETIKFVQIVDTTIEEELYGMTEQDFILKAEKLPARETK